MPAASRQPSAGPKHLAHATVDQALAAVDTSQAARDYARGRAADFTAATQHQARLYRAYVLDALRGVDLGTAAAA